MHSQTVLQSGLTNGYEPYSFPQKSIVSKEKPTSLEAGLPTNARNCPFRQVFVRVWHRHKSQLRGVFKMMVRTFNTYTFPSIAFEHPDNFARIHHRVILQLFHVYYYTRP